MKLIDLFETRTIESTREAIHSKVSWILTKKKSMPHHTNSSDFAGVASALWDQLHFYPVNDLLHGDKDRIKDAIVHFTLAWFKELTLESALVQSWVYLARWIDNLRSIGIKWPELEVIKNKLHSEES